MYRETWLPVGLVFIVLIIVGIHKNLLGTLIKNVDPWVLFHLTKLESFVWDVGTFIFNKLLRAALIEVVYEL